MLFICTLVLLFGDAGSAGHRVVMSLGELTSLMNAVSSGECVPSGRDRDALVSFLSNFGQSLRGAHGMQGSSVDRAQGGGGCCTLRDGGYHSTSSSVNSDRFREEGGRSPGSSVSGCSDRESSPNGTPSKGATNNPGDSPNLSSASDGPVPVLDLDGGIKDLPLTLERVFLPFCNGVSIFPDDVLQSVKKAINWLNQKGITESVLLKYFEHNHNKISSQDLNGSLGDEGCQDNVLVSYLLLQELHILGLDEIGLDRQLFFAMKMVLARHLTEFGACETGDKLSVYNQKRPDSVVNYDVFMRDFPKVTIKAGEARTVAVWFSVLLSSYVKLFLYGKDLQRICEEKKERSGRSQNVVIPVVKHFGSLLSIFDIAENLGINVEFAISHFASFNDGGSISSEEDILRNRVSLDDYSLRVHLFTMNLSRDQKNQFMQGFEGKKKQLLLEWARSTDGLAVGYKSEENSGVELARGSFQKHAKEWLESGNPLFGAWHVSIVRNV